MYKRMAVNGLSVVFGIAVFLGAGSAQGGNPAYFSVYRPGTGSVWYNPPPSYFGYHLDEFAAGYYGGGRYREYYAYGRGVGLADYPGPFAWHGVPPDYRGPRKRALVDPDGPLPVDILPGPPTGQTCVSLVVQAPADAELWLDGVKTNQTGTSRVFESPALQLGGVYTYEIRARWSEQGRNVEQSQFILVHAGDNVRVAFPAVPEVQPPNAPQPFPLAAGPAGRLLPAQGRGFPKNP